MYQALYRKYRPTNFDEVAGQETIVKTLKNAIKKNKISHAYLFTGPRGTGKTSIAKILAKTVNCTSLINGNPCNQCISCQQINSKQTTDVIELDAASNNSVDEIREIRNKVSLVPSNSKYKIYIVDEVHMLTTGAFNALLKTLEEPPSHVIFILATTEPHKIPATILSRCQRFDFKRVSESQIVSRLKSIVESEKIEIDNAALIEIARLSDGGMRDSVSMLDQATAYSSTKITVQDIHDINGTVTQSELKVCVDYILEGDLEKLLSTINSYNESGKNMLKLAEEFLHFFRNLLIAKQVPNYLDCLHINSEIYTSLKTKLSIEKILQTIELINQYILKMKISSNSEILMELLMIQLFHNMAEKKSSVSIAVTTNNNNDDQLAVEKNIFKKENELKPNNNEKVQNHSIKANIKIDNHNYFPGNKKNMSDTQKKDLEQLCSIRINNTLFGFNKTLLNSIKAQLVTLESMLLHPKFSNLASFLLDGELKIASNEYLVFLYDNKSLAFYFNERIPLIEEMTTEALKRNFKVVAIDKEQWEFIKQQFNSKTHQYELMEEPSNIDHIFAEETVDIDDPMKQMFGQIVEYE